MFPDRGPGSLVITASRRLARHLRLQEATRQRSAGHEAWLATRYLPWDAWLRALWEDAAFATEPVARPSLLSGRQAAALWHRVVRATLGDGAALNVGSLAAQSAAAWQRASDWRVSLAEVDEAARGIDARFFVRAASGYVRECEARGWQDPARLTEALIEALGNGSLRVPGPVALAGFQRMTPAATALLQALRDAGTECELQAPPARRGHAVLRDYSNSDAEMLAAGAWARQQLLEAPERRVAIVVPGLSQAADRVRRLVAEGFNPGWQLSPRPQAGVNVSYGRPLADYGFVDTALSLLRLLCEDPDFVTLSRLLRSPWLERASLGERARFEVWLRWLPDRRWSLSRLPSGPTSGAAPGVEPFLETIAAIGEERAAWRGQDWPAAWAARVDELLSRAGWGQGIDVDSETYQLTNAWRGLLNELATIGRVTGRMSGQAAVRELESMARTTLFQPESADDSLPVMGLLEASGLAFDALWIAGMDTTTWPPAQRPDPLLPIALQRDYGMPDATPDDTLDYARLIYLELLQSADDVVVSWPRQDGEALLAPSPLVAGLPAATEEGAPDYFAAGLAGTAELVPVSPDLPPPVAPAEEIVGGHSILSAQRKQPFDAFAGFRLRARPLETPPPGLSARDRGNVIHRVLEAVYRGAGNGPVDAAALAGEVERAVAGELHQYRAGADARLGSLLDLEGPRLVALVRRFLATDARRGLIERVLVEESRAVRVGPLTLHVRPDRIDAVPGGWLIIDYKTGAQGTAVAADADNPTQLQLVTYALSQHGRVCGLAIAIVHPHRVGYTGVRDPQLEWPGRGLRPIDDWTGLLNAWKAQAHSLAEAVAAGDARLNLSLKMADQRAYAILSRHAELSPGE